MNVKLLMSSGMLLVVMLLLFSTWNIGLPDGGVQAILQQDHSLPEHWKKKIIAEADKLRIAPLDAKVDRVWKAIPGYNGLEVDIDKTWRLMKNKPAGSTISYVYKEINPAVSLSELPPNPIYKGNPGKPMVSFMINVAWGNEYIPKILKVLHEEKVKSTFFLDGSWLSKNKELATLLLKEGHELSNHAYSHQNMSTIVRQAAEAEIYKTEQLLKDIGVKNQLFAPPSGDFDEETVQIASGLGLYTILWTIDTVDWKGPKPEWVINKISSRLEPGALILMHPTAASSQALGPMIREAKKRGFAVSTVSDLLSEKRVDTVERRIDF